MQFEIKTGDVFEFSADALVFSASKQPVNGGNFDGRVFAYADGEKLLEARQKIGEIQSGNAAITESFGLKGYRYLIHTVMPNYNSIDYNPIERLKNCYINSLAVAETNNIKSVVFPVLGGGCAGFPSHKTKEFAIQVLSEYHQTQTESCIETITLVLYDKRQEYHDFAAYNGYIRKLSELDFPTKYFNKNSSISRRINRVSDQLIQQIRSETDKIYLQYQKELREFHKQIVGKQAEQSEIPEGIYQAFNDELYKNLFKQNQNMTNEEFAGHIYLNSGSDVSKLKNLTTKEGKRYENAYSFLNSRDNVIRLGIALELCLSDFCRLLWSRGYAFPTSDSDYELIKKYMEEKECDKDQLPEPEAEL